MIIKKEMKPSLLTYLQLYYKKRKLLCNTYLYRELCIFHILIIKHGYNFMNTLKFLWEINTSNKAFLKSGFSLNYLNFLLYVHCSC